MIIVIDLSAPTRECKECVAEGRETNSTYDLAWDTNYQLGNLTLSRAIFQILT